jgi:hypothetical protein
MLRLLARFISLAEAALAAGHKPERIARMRVVRSLQRMGEDIPEGAPERHLEIEAGIDAEFRALGGRAESHAA